MKVYRFKFNETNIGYIDVRAVNKEQALNKAAWLDGEIVINKTNPVIGDLIETIDLNNK